MGARPVAPRGTGDTAVLPESAVEISVSTELRVRVKGPPQYEM